MASKIGRSGLLLVLAAIGGQALAEEPSHTTPAGALISVEGTVDRVFRSVEDETPEHLVVLRVERVEVRKRLSPDASAVVPAPGDVLYAHAGPARGLPARGAKVRVHLVPREAGGWQGVSADWMEVLSAPPTDRFRVPRELPAPPSSLGMTAERVDVNGRAALRVTAVEPDGLAKRSGLEVGDVIVGGSDVTLIDLEELVRRGVPFSLVVLDVRTGKAVELEVAPRADPSNPPAPKPRLPPVTPAPKKLGIATEVVALGGRDGLKVVSVAPGSYAASAGIEVGDILVAADGVPLTSQESLRVALSKAAPTMVLTVRNVRDGKDVPVTVTFVTDPLAPTEKPGPGAPVPPRTPGDGSAIRIERLGILADLGLRDVEAAVEVIEVFRGGAAARAGIRPGSLIFQAGGQKVLSPKALDEAVRASGRTIRLGVEDPTTGTTNTVDITLD